MVIFDHLSGVDYGDFSVVPGYLPESHARITEQMRPVLKAGVVPIVLGGDHSVTLPELRAVAEKHGPVALIHFDSHGDLWDEYFGFLVYTADEVRQAGLDEVIKAVKERAGTGPCFLTFDIDFVDPTFAPATGTPEVGGFTSWESQYLIRGLQGVQFVAFDLVEVSPPYDNEGATTCLLAANLVYEFISLLALAKAT